MLKIMRDNLRVLKYRFMFRGKPRLSAFADIFANNLYRFIPVNKIKPAHEFLNKIIDRILWM